jgi:ferredoxin-NADP reductase/nitrite reductase/ring-hydroxylating ferredoxin subunit
VRPGEVGGMASGQRIADLADVPPPGKGAHTVVVDGAEVGIFRLANEIVAWRNVCPHAAAPVCRGTVDGTRLPSMVYEYEYGRDQEILQCPWHGWEFDLRNGRHLAEGSAVKLRPHPITVANGVIYDASPRSAAQLRLRILERSDETPGIAVLRLVSADGGTLPAWTPGTHLEFRLPSGLVRHYSLCSEPRDRSSYRIAVFREKSGRGGSLELHELAQPGFELEVQAVRNRFRLREAPHSLLLAGGIGITPMLSMAASLRRRRKSFSLLYVGPDRASMVFAHELDGLPDTELIETHRQGRPNLQARIAQVPDGTAVYGCGPAGMIAELKAIAAAEAGRVRCFVEAFDGAEFSPASDPSTDVGFEVELARSGVTVTVEPRQSILTAVRKVVPAPSSCEQGWCGSCETTVLGGEPDHRDRVLTEGEREVAGTMMICVGRARSERLVLDL